MKKQLSLCAKKILKYKKVGSREHQSLNEWEQTTPAAPLLVFRTNKTFLVLHKCPASLRGRGHRNEPECGTE